MLYDTSSLIFLSTLSLRRATSASYNAHLAESISIHALLAESDSSPNTSIIILDISIHALLAESDDARCFQFVCKSGFLSTLSLRRATLAARDESIMFVFLSTLSLRRATLITASESSLRVLFLSTLSLRRATSAVWARTAALAISIHALLAESDR